MEQAIEYRAYVQAKAVNDAADTPEKRKVMERSEMGDLVTEIEFALAEEQRRHQ